MFKLVPDDQSSDKSQLEPSTLSWLTQNVISVLSSGRLPSSILSFAIKKLPLPSLRGISWGGTTWVTSPSTVAKGPRVERQPGSRKQITRVARSACCMHTSPITQCRFVCRVAKTHWLPTLSSPPAASSTAHVQNAAGPWDRHHCHCRLLFAGVQEGRRHPRGTASQGKRNANA